MQQSPLRAVRESLIDSQVAGKHYPHLVRSVQNLLCLKGSVEVAGKVKQPGALSPDFRADKADTFVPIPVLPASPASSDFCFDLHGVIVRFRDTAGDAAIPRIAIAALGEDRRVALQGCVLGGADGSSSHISCDDEVANAVRRLAHGNAGQDIVEELEFCASAVTGDNASILPQDPELEVAHKRFHHKRSLASCRRQLPEKNNDGTRVTHRTR